LMANPRLNCFRFLYSENEEHFAAVQNVPAAR
jgi:hypothetical protein